MYRLILFLLAVVFFNGCDRMPKDARWLYIANNSDQEVVYYSSRSYPDTIHFALSGCTNMEHKISPGESKVYRRYGSWEELLDEIPSKTLMFFVYSANSVKSVTKNATSCDSLAGRKDLILKRFDVTIDYLNANNWELVYP